MIRASATLFVIAVSVLAARDVHATAAPPLPIAVIFLTEPLVPDVRLELDFDFSEPRIVLGLPLYLRAHKGDGFEVNALFEPQLRTDRIEARGIVGARITHRIGRSAFIIFAEGGAIAGTDGFGGMIGAGFSAYELFPGLSCCSLVFRETFTHQGVRHDISLDVFTAYW
jgi:hypothetical protein